MMTADDAPNDAPHESLLLAPCFRLTLDAEGIYWGATQIHADDVQPGDVVLDHLPDNPPGKYRWSRESAVFLPLPPSQQKQAPSAPDLEQAFDALCELLSDGNELKLPPAVSAWRIWYRATLDQRKKD